MSIFNDRKVYSINSEKHKLSFKYYLFNRVSTSCSFCKSQKKPYMSPLEDFSLVNLLSTAFPDLGGDIRKGLPCEGCVKQLLEDEETFIFKFNMGLL